jgi:WD40 repeat protein
MEKELKAKNKETKLNARDIKNPILSSVTAPSGVEKKIIAHKGETTALAFNIDGDILYTGGGDGLVKGWRIKDGKQVAEMQGFKKPITGLSCDINNKFLCASSLDGHRI